MLRNTIGVAVGFMAGFVAAMMVISLYAFADHLAAGMTQQEGSKSFFVVWLRGVRVLLPSIAQAVQVVVGGLVASRVGKAAPSVLVSLVGTLTAMVWLHAYVGVAVAGNPSLESAQFFNFLLYPPVIWRTIVHAKRMRSGLAAATVQAASG